MRLIDADALLDKQEALYMKRHILFHGVTAYTIESSPTVDPETLPIVQELRAQLAKVTAERDALLKEVAGECGLCLHYDTCKNSDKNTCFLGSEWEWRGTE